MVERCASCRHFTPPTSDNDPDDPDPFGECAAIDGYSYDGLAATSGLHTDGNALSVRAGFGCVLWASRGDGDE